MQSGVPPCVSVVSQCPLCVADAILGKQNTYADLYSPSRKLTWVPPLLPALSFTYVKNTVSVSHILISFVLSMHYQCIHAVLYSPGKMLI